MELELVYDTVDLIPENFRDLYEERDGKFHFAVGKFKGLKTQADVDYVKDALRKEREDHVKTREGLKPWGDLKPDEVRAQLDRIPELEAAAEGKLDEEKIGELVERRLKQKTGPIERQVATLTEERDRVAAENAQLKAQIETKDRNDIVRSAATEARVHATAIPDIEMTAAAYLERDESGALVTRDGIPGLTPGLGMKEFMREMQKLRPHWWPESEGGGGRGAGGRGGQGGNNPFSAEHWNMTEQGRILNTEGREVADRLARAAGTTVGGAKPAPRR